MTTFPIPNLTELSNTPPGMLYPFQADGVAFLLSKKRVVLADDMGLGKTRQAIVAMNVGAPRGTSLVVCPASLKLNWRREIRMVDPDPVVEVIGAKDGASEGAPRWVIVNYDLLTKNAARLHDTPAQLLTSLIVRAAGRSRRWMQKLTRSTKWLIRTS